MFKLYCEDTSLHGFQFLPRQHGGAPQTWAHRLFWGTVITLSMTAAGFFLITNARDYSRKSVITSLESTTETLDNAFFPAITVCSLNQMQRSFLKRVKLEGEEHRINRTILMQYFRLGIDKGNGAEGVQDIIAKREMQEVFCEKADSELPKYLPRPKMTPEGRCRLYDNSDFLDYFGLMTTQTENGFTVMSADYNKTKVFHYKTNLGTDKGICKTIVPSVDFNKANIGYSFLHWKNVSAGTVSGIANGVEILIDSEAYDHGDDFSAGTGALFLLHHHRDYPIMKFGSISTSPGTITEISITPVLTQTTEQALTGYDPDRRNCYLDEEFEFTHLPTSIGYRYSTSNCMFESAYNETLRKCQCKIISHAQVLKNIFRYGEDVTAEKIDSCTGQQLKCALDIFEDISTKNTAYNKVSGKVEPCLPACQDQVNTIAYSKSSYPAPDIFKNFEDFCLLFVKLMTQCKKPHKKMILDANYKFICPAILEMEAVFLEQKQKIIKEYGLDNFDIPEPPDIDTLAGLSPELDDFSGKPPLGGRKPFGIPSRGDRAPPSHNLLPTRTDWISKYCDRDASLWLSALNTYPEDKKTTFLEEMQRYGKENMLRANIYIQNPFTTSYKRDVDTTLISFIANVGGLVGLCMGFSLVSLFEILYFCIAGVVKMFPRSSKTDSLTAAYNSLKLKTKFLK